MQADQPLQIPVQLLVMIEASHKLGVNEYEAFERACKRHTVASVGLMLRDDLEEDQIMVSALICLANSD